MSNKDKQLDLYGGETEVSKMDYQKTTRKATIKEIFRSSAGFDKTHKCKDCAYLVGYVSGNRKYYKCKKIGITSSEATDIRLSDDSCCMFTEKRKGELNEF